MSRSSVGDDIPQIDVAIKSFLGSPMLFYGHQNLFEKGVGAFNAYADFVNQMQPDTQWRSLGFIARRSHLLRRREDGGVDVRMLSGEMDLVNSSGDVKTFYIQRLGESVPDYASLTVDGSPTSRTQHSSALQIRIPAGQVRKFRIIYRNDLDLSHLDIGKSNLYAYALRMGSDFRDRCLSRSSWGNALSRAYYRHHWNSAELYLEQKWWASIICVGLAVIGMLYQRRRTNNRLKSAGSRPRDRYKKTLTSR